MVEPALTQLTKLTANETHRLARAIVAISVNPELGTAVPDTLLRGPGPAMEATAASTAPRSRKPQEGRACAIEL